MREGLWLAALGKRPRGQNPRHPRLRANRSRPSAQRARGFNLRVLAHDPSLFGPTVSSSLDETDASAVAKDRGRGHGGEPRARWATGPRPIRPKPRMPRGFAREVVSQCGSRGLRAWKGVLPRRGASGRAAGRRCIGHGVIGQAGGIARTMPRAVAAGTSWHRNRHPSGK